ncbi:MAG: MFS transporter [Pseudomonadota bacterium]
MTDTTSEDNRTYPRPAYAWYVVVLMMFFYVLSFMDRQIIAVLIDPIKADLALTDVQISLIGGVSFGLFYSIVGIFIGRLADSMNRPFLIAAGVFIWSLTTALCGLASKFWQLLVLRMGVGLGEAALLPSTLSLLADYFPANRRATPTSVFLLGAPIGIGLSFAIGGYLFSVAKELTATDGWADVAFVGGAAAWQLVLIFLGVLGMVMTAAMITVREPRSRALQRAASDTSTPAAEPADLLTVRRYARKHRKAIVALYVTMAMISLAAYGQGFWDIAYLIRTYELDTATASFQYGMVQLFAGLAGMLTGGIVADRLSARGIDGASYRMVIIGAAIATPFSFLYPIMDSKNLGLVFMALAIFGSNICFASAAAALQRMFPVVMIGVDAGVYYFLSNSIGLLVGPFAIAAGTDYILGDPDQIRYSISVVTGVARAIGLLLVLWGLSAYLKTLAETKE